MPTTPAPTIDHPAHGREPPRLSRRRRFGRWLLVVLMTNVLRAWCCTWRVRLVGDSKLRPEIYALLHGCILSTVFPFRNWGLVLMISQHRDGDLIARVAERLGHRTARGSSTRGARAASLNLLREHADTPWVITPDGPKGPRATVKPGLIRLAAASGREVRPVVTAARPAVHFRSWDRMALPWPFAKVIVSFGEPLHVPAEPSDEACRALATELERRLQECEKVAEQRLADW